MPIHSENEVPRIHIRELTTEHFLKRHQQTGQPIVISGLLDGEPDWDLDFLSGRIGPREVLVRRYGNERYTRDKRTWTNIGSGVELLTMTFAQYAELLRSGSAAQQGLYLAKQPLAIADLAQTRAFDAIGAQLGLESTRSFNLWSGPGGHVECLHYDPFDGTLMQLHGEKQVLLFPPGQTYNLYPFPSYVHLRYGLKLRSWFSQVYPQHPDLAAFPRFRKALPHLRKVHLPRGDLLYIPAGWWHEVIALGNESVCSVNRFWQVPSVARILGNPALLRLAGVFPFALPHVALGVARALLSPDRSRKIRELLHLT